MSEKPCLELLSSLAAIMQDANNHDLTIEAVNITERIVARFGKRDPQRILACMEPLLNQLRKEHNSHNIQVVTLHCLSSAVEAAEDALASHLPSFVESILHSLERSMGAGTEDGRLHRASYAAMDSILAHVPWILSQAGLDRLLEACFESAQLQMGPDCDKARQNTIRQVTKNKDIQDCLSALNRTWEVAMQEGPTAVQEFMQALQSIIEEIPKTKVAQYSVRLEELLLKAFGLRRIQLSPRTDDSYKESEINVAEAAINKAVLAFVYKLNDVTFRPIFIRIVDWAIDASPDHDVEAKRLRQNTLYNFLLYFFSNLKVNPTSSMSFCSVLTALVCCS